MVGYTKEEKRFLDSVAIAALRISIEHTASEDIEGTLRTNALPIVAKKCYDIAEELLEERLSRYER